MSYCGLANGNTSSVLRVERSIHFACQLDDASLCFLDAGQGRILSEEDHADVFVLIEGMLQHCVGVGPLHIFEGQPTHLWVYMSGVPAGATQEEGNTELFLLLLTHFLRPRYSTSP